MSHRYYDSFNRADAGSLGGNWTVTAGTWTVASSMAHPTVNKSFAVYDGGGAISWAANQWSLVTLKTNLGALPAVGGGLVLRSTGAGENGYVLTGSSGGGQIYKAVAGTYTALGSASSTVYAVGDVLYGQVVGSDLVLKRNEVTDVTVTGDTTYTSGSPGMLHASATANKDFDDWNGGDFEPETRPTPNYKHRFKRGRDRLTRWRREGWFSGIVHRASWFSKHLVLPAAAGGGITGTAAITLDDLTVAGSGALVIRGTAGITLDNVTVSGTGALAITGVGAATLGALTLAGTGTLPISGAGAATLGVLTLAGTGALALVGTGAATLEDLTLAGVGSGSTGITGTASIALGDMAAAGTGALAISGSGLPTLEVLTVSGTGRLAISGTGAATLAELTLSGSGTLAIQATLATTLEDLGVVATGTSPRLASAAITLEDLLTTGEGHLAILGTLSATLADVTLFATGLDPDAGGPPGAADHVRSPIVRTGHLLSA